MLTPISVANPVYSTPDGTMIDCEVSWRVTETNEVLPAAAFTAYSADDMQHSIDLYNALVAGTYGPVGAMQPNDVLDSYKFDATRYRQGYQQGGVVINTTINWQSDDDSLSRMANAIQAAEITSMSPIYWQLPDGSVVNYSIANFREIFRAITNFTNQCMQREGEIIALLEAASDPSNVDIESGYPSNQLTVTLT